MPVTRNHLFCFAFFGVSFMLTISVLYYGNVISVDSTVITSSRWAFSGLMVPTEVPTHVNCSCSPDVGFSTFLLTVVPSGPSDKDSRQVIRDTWFEGFNNSQDVALRFIVGTKAMEYDEQVKLIKENGTFGDIIFVDTKEDFSARTNKTLALINWAHRYVKFSYLFKCDYETYVFVKNVIVELKKRPTTTKLYYGKVFRSASIIRGDSKYADNNWNLGQTYLPYAQGGGYILSHDLVSSLSEQSPRLMWHVNEDTAVGAWVSVLDHEERSDGKFCAWHKGQSIDCKFPILAITLNDHTTEEIQKHFHYLHKHSSDNTTVVNYINNGGNRNPS